jgi:hypothetical protein
MRAKYEVEGLEIQILTFCQQNHGLHELYEGNITVIILIDQCEEILDEHRVILHRKRLGKFMLQNNQLDLHVHRGPKVTARQHATRDIN